MMLEIYEASTIPPGERLACNHHACAASASMRVVLLNIDTRYRVHLCYCIRHTPNLNG